VSSAEIFRKQRRSAMSSSDSLQLGKIPGPTPTRIGNPLDPAFESYPELLKPTYVKKTFVLRRCTVAYFKYFVLGYPE